MSSINNITSDKEIIKWQNEVIKKLQSIIQDKHKKIDGLINKYSNQFAQLIRVNSKIHLGMADAVKLFIKDLKTLTTKQRRVRC